MHKMIQALEQEHCDVKDALSRCMGMEDLYLELLQIFAEDDGMDKLMDAYDRGDVQDVFFHAHTLKGVYTNLGMNHLYELVYPVVEETRGKCPDNLKSLEKSVRKLCEEHKKITAVIQAYI